MTCSSLLVFSAHFNQSPQLFVSILCLVLCPLSSSVLYLFWKSNLFWDTTKVVILEYTECFRRLNSQPRNILVVLLFFLGISLMFATSCIFVVGLQNLFTKSRLELDALGFQRSHADSIFTLPQRLLA